MKILQLIPQLSSGGAERFVVDISNELSKRHEVCLAVSFSLEGAIAFYKSELSSAVKVVSLNKKLGFDTAYLYRLYKTIKQEAPDIVHTHLDAYTHFAILKWLFPRVKFVHTLHSDAQFESGGRLKAILKKTFFRRGWCKAATISRASDDSFKALYGANMDSTLIYNGRTMNIEWSAKELVPRTEGIFNLVSIGHISQVKNHMLMCSAVDQLTKKGAPIELYMFGRFADESIFERIKALNNPHIHMLGEVENPRQYLRNADVYCMSSVVEGMPISLIEALSCGLVPVCTAVGGIVDMVEEGKNGFLSHDMSVESYVKALEQVLAMTPQEMEAMKCACRESAKRYSIEECAKQYEELFAK
jgi:glycosyltransferase involved in cell wall biosynthesis